MKHTNNISIYRFALDPLFIGSFLVMVVNDHLLRPWGLCTAVTGKLSDFAILLFLPAAGALVSVYLRFICLMVYSIVVKVPEKKVRLTIYDALLGIAASGGTFILIKTSPQCNTFYIDFINRINLLRPIFPRLGSTSDITDCIALPSLLLSYLVMRKYFKSNE